MTPLEKHTTLALLNQFKGITLEEMDASQLQNRVDTKYLITAEQLISLLAELDNDYRVVEIDGRRTFTYRSLYFDTPKFDLYNLHQRGFKNRYKLRVRNYVESDLFFFEVKIKHKGRTVKQRIPIKDLSTSIQPSMLQFYQDRVAQGVTDLNASTITTYKRITLVANDQSERVTIDYELSFNLLKQDQVSVPGKVILELKQEGINRNSLIYKQLRKRGIRPSSISKYCVGTSLLNPDLRQNKLKRVLRRLNS